jgi:hypothetical protein
MRPVKSLLLASGAALALVGSVALANAQTEPSHVMNVTLPDGSVAQIRYAGDVPPRVEFAPAGLPVALTANPFPAFDRLIAQMDLQTAAMLRAAQAMAAQPVFAALPPGVQGYSTVTTFSGNGVCTRSTTYESQGAGAPPRLVTHVSGTCGPTVAPRDMLPAVQPEAPAPVRTPRTITVKADQLQPAYRVAWQQ